MTPHFRGGMLGRRRASGIPFSAVVFLSGFEGVDAATSFTDESSFGHTITTLGSAQIDTAQAKFGTSSLLCDGAGSEGAQCADSAEFEFGSGPFTIEGWYRFTAINTSTKGNCGLATKGQLNSGNVSWALRLTTTAPGSVPGITLDLSTDGSTVTAVSAAFTFALNTWYHIAADRDASGVVRVYVNGVMVASATFASALLNGAGTFNVGLYSFSSFNRALDGWADEVRITKGYAWYGSDLGFTPPVAAFPRS